MKRTVASALALACACATVSTRKAAAPDAAAMLREVDAAFQHASSEDVPLLAPAHFDEAVRLYRLAATALKNNNESEAVSNAQMALKAVDAATSTASRTRELLRETVTVRTTVLGLDDSMSSRSASGTELLKQAAAAAEENKSEQALQTALQATNAYTAAAAAYLREKRLPLVREEIAQMQGKARPSDIARAQAEVANIEAALSSLASGQITEIVNRLKRIDEFFFPPFYRLPPSKLQVADFVLHVIRYEHREWDFANGRIIHASGTAWLLFDCQPVIHRPPFWQLATIDRDLRVVDTVKDATREIAITDAKQIKTSAVVGSTVTLKLPAYATTGAQVSQAVQQQIQWLLKPAGAITVHFDDLTIRPIGTPDTGLVLAGTATYPTVPPDPPNASLVLEGFILYLHSLTLTPQRATVQAELEMPVSIVDPGTGHPGRVDLGSFQISSRCSFRRELPQTAYGPWGIGNTGMQIKGKAVVADFDRSWASPMAPPGSPAATPSWRGVLLGSGTTVPAPPPISNSGYLSAAYSYPIALVTAPGLDAQLTLTAPFEIESLEPYGYRVSISTGRVHLVGSAVADGQFDRDKLVLPRQAVLTTTGSAVQAQHELLQLNANLDLVGSATLSVPIRWGEFTAHPASTTFYEARGFSFGRFYLAGTYRSNYFPLDAADNFVEPNAILNPLPAIGLQGLTVFFPEFFQVDTVDTPTRAPLNFVSTNPSDRATADWLNFSFGGVHGRLQNLRTQTGTKTDLGPIYQPFYVGQKPFFAGVASGAKENLGRQYSLTIKFVSSAVYDSNMEGAIAVPQPVNANLDFSNMAFTSTAQISGAKLPMTNPLPLAYWGLDMVKKPGTTSAGVISVRTGQVFFTAAGIRELRHFAMPFYLIWGEMLASGAIRRLDFDYNGAGQKFDRFGYTTSFVKLSDYDPAKQAYLKTAGMVSFDVFGAKYVNINDAYDTTHPAAPYNNRNVALANDSDPSGPYRATDHGLNADWGNGFGHLTFTFDYDANAQDGFVGPGTMAVQWVDQNLQSSIVLKSNRICMSANDTNRHDLTLGPFAHFGAMSRVTGCGCIANHQLERIVLSAELESTTDVNIALRKATYGEVQMMFTPSISSVEVAGDMYLTIISGGNLEVKGAAKFTVNRDQGYVEGDVDGQFDTASALGLNSLSGNGHLNWHLGTLSGTGYQSIQGQLALSVVTPLAGGSAEGGFYVGLNAPLSEAWVLQAAGPHYQLNTSALPARLTGLYGYVKGGASVNFYILSGGYDVFVGLGGFVLTPQQALDLNAQSTANVVGLPYVIGNVGAHAWGSILGGLVSADGWADLQVILPYPFQFQGDIGLSACVLWVACGSADVTVGLNSSRGFYLQ